MILVTWTQLRKKINEHLNYMDNIKQEIHEVYLNVLVSQVVLCSLRKRNQS